MLHSLILICLLTMLRALPTVVIKVSNICIGVSFGIKATQRHSNSFNSITTYALRAPPPLA